LVGGGASVSSNRHGYLESEESELLPYYNPGSKCEPRSLSSELEINMSYHLLSPKQDRGSLLY